MNPSQPTRRHFLQAGAATLAAGEWSVLAAEPLEPQLADAVAGLEPYFTPPGQFQDVSRGKPIPHQLSLEQKRAAGLTRSTWKLHVISDPEHPANIARPLTTKNGTALDFRGLLEMGAKHAVRFPKIMTCLNLGCPLGMGIWEGVPLREVIWRTGPRENLRRVFYYGFHNNDPGQMFRSSLPIGRVLEDPFDLPPVILCYKLNGRWLNSQRGGPVRLVVPEAYGFKSVKWLTHVVLTNLYHANDTYALANNDIDSPLKTFADTLTVPAQARAGTPIPITGYAQVGIPGLAKVQVWIHPADKTWPVDDPHFSRAPWRDAHVLPPPVQWGGQLPGDKIPANTLGFDNATTRPSTWPMRLCKVHWAALLPGLPAGEYILRCRSVDGKRQAQPMPRPFRKSGRCAIASSRISIKA